MPNINDYLDWRGDLPFSASPFNEVDNLILSELAFVDFYGVVPEMLSDPISLRDAAARLSVFRVEDSVETGVMVPRELFPLFRRASESKRFGDILLCGYESRTDTVSEVQFAAVTMLLADGSAFISFRGTDDSLVGWKEDFNMSFLSVIPSQSFAARYLDRVAEIFPEAIRLGGHSKGGNLAVYAAASASEETQKRILCVYNNDGPGFSREVLSSDGYTRIRDRVKTIVPETSIVGMLLEHECDYTIVKSSQSGLFQHDGFSWEVLGNAFVSLADRTSGSKIIDRTVKSWLASISTEEREQFVEALYAALSSTRAETLSDIYADKDALSKILKSITREQRSILQKVLRRLIYEGQKAYRADRSAKRTEKREERLRRRDAERSVAEEKTLEKVDEPVTPSAQKKRDRLMVAVRPIRFHIIKVQHCRKKRVE